MNRHFHRLSFWFQMSKSRKTLLIAGLFLLLLGLGNLLYANDKKAEYLDILSGANTNLSIPDLMKQHPLHSILSSYISLDKQVEHLAKVKARIGYYDFVAAGGKTLILAAAIIILLGTIRFKTLNGGPDHTNRSQR